MYFKHCIYTGFIVLCLNIGKAQIAQFGILSGVSVGTFSSPSLKQFSNVYNANNKALLSKEINPPRFSYGFSIQPQVIIAERLYTAIEYASIHANSHATFINDASRHIDTKQSYFSSLIGFCNKTETHEFAVYTGFAGSSYFVTTYVKYPTGDKDFNYGIVNGTYNTVGFSIPFIAHYAKNISSKLSVYLKAKALIVSATKFTLYKNTAGIVNSSGFTYDNVEVIDDTKKFMVEFGLKYDFN